jgi:serine/threonine protein kinase
LQLSSGARLGPYEILSPLGAGGMGEVYKARDTRLDRIVAIKVLPAALASDPQFRERFDREARIISALDHPHICALYDVGELPPTGAGDAAVSGVRFLVMQFLEGETLADRLAKGPLSIDAAIDIGIQIADALHRAHRAAIVHRDLKPGNVFLVGRGRSERPLAKLLDFGLAKTTADGAGRVSATMAPTTPAAITEQGTILGTFQYMAPEQIEGQEADARSDIFALGAMLYEMFTGRPAFSGRTRAALMSAILKDEPPPLAVDEPIASLALDRVVRTCLAKDPEDRWQTAREVERELRRSRQQPATSRVTALAGRRQPLGKRPRALIAAAAIVVLAIMVATAMIVLRTPQSAPRFVFTIQAPSNTEFPTGSGATPWPIVSPSGAQVAFAAVDRDGVVRLWVRDLATAETRPLAGTEQVEQPFWSPDGRAIGFFAGRKLKRVDLATGTIQTLCDVSGTPRKAAWSRSGVIVFAVGGQPLHRVSANGGMPQAATTLDAARRENAHLYPSFLPDGRGFLFLAETADADQSVVVAGSLDSPALTPIIAAHSESQYAEPGYLLYVRGGTLLAQPFDARRLRVTGDAAVAAASVSFTAVSGIAAFSTGPGVLVYRTSAERAPQSQLVWRDRGGRLLERVGESGSFHNPEASRDGRSIAVERFTDNSANIWILDVTRGVGSRLTLSNSIDVWPLWSPDGSRVAFMSNREGAGRFNIYIRSIADATPESIAVRDAMPLGWAPDGRSLICTPGGPRTGGWMTLAACPLGGGAPEPLMRFDSGVTTIDFSPDGRWLTYVSEESGRPEVYVRRYPDGADRARVSTGGGSQPRWRRDMRELFYLAPGGRLMGANVQSGTRLDIGTPQMLFELRALTSRQITDRQQYTTTDGQRFLVNEATGNELAGLTVVLNWTAALGQVK